MTLLFAIGESFFSPMHLLVIGVVAILFFGRRLPEVMRNLGKGVMEFKKGIKGLEDDMEPSNQQPRYDQPAEQPRPPQRITATAPKFEDNPPAVSAPPRASSPTPKFEDSPNNVTTPPKV
jgi:sec-independent protein translocase protein TatA